MQTPNREVFIQQTSERNRGIKTLGNKSQSSSKLTNPHKLSLFVFWGNFLVSKTIKPTHQDHTNVPKCL